MRVTATKLAPRKNDFIFALAELQVFDQNGHNIALSKTVTALDSIEAPPRWRKSNLTDGLAPVAPSPDEKSNCQGARDVAAQLSRTKPPRRNALLSLRRKRSWMPRLKKLPAPSMVYAGGIHDGGGAFRGTGAGWRQAAPDFCAGTRTGHAARERNVGPGRLSVLELCARALSPPTDAPEGERRAASRSGSPMRANPLTWRSIVNRVWQYHFGRGLVETPNDFGRNGDCPVIPNCSTGWPRSFATAVARSSKLAPADRDERHLSTVFRQRSEMQKKCDAEQRPPVAAESPQT